jgi:tRNA(Ile)-lysidine synthase
LRAIHVHHGFEGSDRLQQAAQALSDRFNIPLVIIPVVVEDALGEGLEAAARRARYQAFSQQLHSGECLLLAHHLQDQAETVLFRLLRGTGLKGLAAMSECAPIGVGERIRPWLAIDEQVIRKAAEGLPFFDDPMNQDTRFDRVYLRRTIWPLLTARFGQASHSLSRLARLAEEVTADKTDALPQWYQPGQRVLPRVALMRLSQAARFTLLRHCVAALGFRQPALTHWEEWDRTILGAHTSRRSVLRTGEVEWRLSNDAVYVGPHLPELVVPSDSRVTVEKPLELVGLGEVRLSQGTASDSDTRANGDMRSQSFEVVRANGCAPFSVEDDPKARSAAYWLKQAQCPAWVRDRAVIIRVEGMPAWLLAPGLCLRTPVVTKRFHGLHAAYHSTNVWLWDRLSDVY